jgi:glyoxylase-like metal-dependent hydrolase (beta-lactamase superfamily II)
MEIIPNVHLLSSMAVNFFLIVDPDGLTLVDAGAPRSQRKVFKYIARLGYAPGDLRRVLITHTDGDHVGGLAALKAASGARVYASPIEAEAMAAGRKSREFNLRGWKKLLLSSMFSFFKAQPVSADEHLSDGQVLPILGGLRVVETPGHTPGHLSFFAPSAGVLFTGDSIRSERAGLVVSSGWNTWDEEQARASAQAQAALGARWVCSGHGPVVEEAEFPSL